MKSYLKNKGFIPESFRSRINIQINSGNKRGILIIVILNIYLIPISINKIDKLTVPMESSVTLSGDLLVEEGEKEKLIGWLSKIDNSIISMKIKNNLGEIVVSTLEEVSNLEEKELLDIKSVEKNDKGNYKINVKD